MMEGHIKLTSEEIQELIEDGQVIIFRDGRKPQLITKEDLRFSVDEIEKFEKENVKR